MGLLLLAAIAALALTGGSAPSGRLPTPPPPKKPPPQRTPLPPITLSMLEGPAGPAPAAVPPGRVRVVKHGLRVARTEDDDSSYFADDSNVGGSDKRLFGFDIGDAKAITLRVWIETTYLPAKDVHGSWCSEWRFGGVADVGVVPKILGPIALDCPSGGLQWVQMQAAISVDRTLWIRAVYPGKPHTGAQRGATYTLVVEWMPALPQEIPFSSWS